MEVLDTAKQSTYFTINEAKHTHFGMVLLYKKSHCLAVLGQLQLSETKQTQFQVTQSFLTRWGYRHLNLTRFHHKITEIKHGLSSSWLHLGINQIVSFELIFTAKKALFGNYIK